MIISYCQHFSGLSTKYRITLTYVASFHFCRLKISLSNITPTSLPNSENDQSRYWSYNGIILYSIDPEYKWETVQIL